MRITCLCSYVGRHALTRSTILAPSLPEITPMWCDVEKGHELQNPEASPVAFPSAPGGISFLRCPCAEPELFLFEHQ
jgi:hypothetical protein